jgi:hypothetical protein
MLVGRYPPNLFPRDTSLSSPPSEQHFDQPLEQIAFKFPQRADDDFDNSAVSRGADKGAVRGPVRWGC